MRYANYLVLSITLFILSVSLHAQNIANDSIQATRSLKLFLPTPDTNYFNTIDYTLIIRQDSLHQHSKLVDNNTSKIKITSETNDINTNTIVEATEPDKSYENAINFLENYYSQPTKTKHDSIIQASLDLLIDIASYTKLRQLLDSANRLVKTTNIELKINTLNQYLDTLNILKSEYNLLRESKHNIDSLISLNDSLGLSSMDTNFIDQISLILNQSADLDSAPSLISVDTLLHTYYIPDSLIVSIKEFINGIKKDSLINWITEIQSDTVDLYFIDTNKDSIHLQLYKNSPEIIHLNVTDVWGTKTPAIIRDIQKGSFKLVLDESAEINQVSVDESKKALRKYSIGNSTGIITLSKRDVPIYFKPWSFHGNANFNIAQIAFHQWTQGGESSISLLLGSELWWKYRKNRHSWNNYFKIKFGFIRQGEYTDTSAFFKSNEDQLEYTTRYNYKIKPKLYGAFLVNFKTRTLSSYDYPTPSTRVIKAKFMNPADLTFSVGIEYRYDRKNIFFFSPLAWKNTMVLDAEVDETRYGLVEGESIRQTLGMNIIAHNNFNLFDDIVLKSTLELFSNYLDKPQNIDINWELEILLPVNNYIMSKISCSFIYDDDVTVTKKDSDGNSFDSKGGQFTERISVGLMIKF